MPNTTYTYSIADDFPGATANLGKLDVAIRASAIVTALDSVSSTGDVVSITFKDELSSGDKTLLDGDVTGPVGGLIAAHDNTADVDPIKEVKFSEPQLVCQKPISIGERLWAFSHNCCDKTTWFGDAIRVVNEAVGTGDGVELNFTLDNPNVIDLAHGKVTDEDRIVPTAAQGGTSYLVEVKVDGVTKTEREFGEASGGDYTVNYTTGVVSFFTAPGNGLAVTAAYFYSPANAGSTIYFRPPAGKIWSITQVELQFSADLELTDTFMNAIATYYPPAGAPPAKFIYPPSLIHFKRAADFLNWTRGSFPQVQNFGGATRGLGQDCIQLRFDYISPVPLLSSQGAEMRVWTKHHRPLGGAYGYATIYGIEEDE